MRNSERQYWVAKAAIFLVAAQIALVAVSCTSKVITIDKPPESNPARIEDVALYTFDAIEINPEKVTVGDLISIRMKVVNTGRAVGIYEAKLSIDGVLVESKSYSLKSLESAVVEFSAQLSKPGLHTIAIEPQKSEVTVTAKRVSIRMDHDAIDGCDPLVGSTSFQQHMFATDEGHMITMNSPDDLIIESISILGYIKSSTYDFNNSNMVGGPGSWVYGPDIKMVESTIPVFTINIYDANRKKLFSGDFQKELFSYSPKWVTVSVPDIPVRGDFNIELLTRNQPRLNSLGGGEFDVQRRYVVHTWYYQLCVGYENAVDVKSWVSMGDGTIVPGHYFTYNWLIRAEGYPSTN